MTAFSMTALSAALPEIFMALSAMGLLMIGVFRGNAQTRTIGWFSVVVMAVAAGLVCGTSASPGTAFGGMFVADDFARFAKVLVLLGASPCRDPVLCLHRTRGNGAV